ncbi:MAG: HAD-IA family hydrolase [Elusimicrobiaceae bacterium]|nr:HAD-IA family hydrolase [Elusimicrobiaceae bacterium]
MKTIVFDLGGVFVDWNPRYLYRKIFSSSEEMEWFLSNVCTSVWNARQDAGRTFAEGAELLKKDYPGYAVQIDAYFARWEEMFGPDIAGTKEIFWELKAKGFKVYALTNWSKETFPKAKEMFEVFTQFDGVLVSGEEGLNKPDPRIYQRFLDKFSLRAEKCVFIDDNAANVAAAHTVGMDGIRFENAELLREELQKRGIL